MLSSLSSCLIRTAIKSMAGAFLAPSKRGRRKLTFTRSIEVGVGDLHRSGGLCGALRNGIVEAVLHQVRPALGYFEAIAP
jgi:hypothetical protein